jgi:hypothetical protein
MAAEVESARAPPIMAISVYLAAKALLGPAIVAPAMTKKALTVLFWSIYSG